jgi:MarR family 2-MHQ and catechol resistance regulon transcriptional repressor
MVELLAWLPPRSVPKRVGMDAKNPKQRLKGNASAPHLWLVMWKALSAMARQLDDDLQRCGLSNTDFRVLEALLHKGPLPVNVIGPKVNLTAGAISVAIDRLEIRGLVARVEGKRDRRVRMVALTKEGEKMISPVYSRHAALLERIFEPLSESQRLSLEGMLKAVGKNAETMAEMPED